VLVSFCVLVLALLVSRLSGPGFAEKFSFYVPLFFVGFFFFVCLLFFFCCFRCCVFCGFMLFINRCLFVLLPVVDFVINEDRSNLCFLGVFCVLWCWVYFFCLWSFFHLLGLCGDWLVLSVCLVWGLVGW